MLQAEKVAEIKHLSLDEVLEPTLLNAKLLFGIAEQQDTDIDGSWSLVPEACEPVQELAHRWVGVIRGSSATHAARKAWRANKELVRVALTRSGEEVQLVDLSGWEVRQRYAIEHRDVCE